MKMKLIESHYRSGLPNPEIKRFIDYYFDMYITNPVYRIEFFTGEGNLSIHIYEVIE